MAAAMVAQLIVGIVIAYMTPFLDKELLRYTISGHGPCIQGNGVAETLSIGAYK